MKKLILLSLTFIALALVGCKKKQGSSKAPGGQTSEEQKYTVTLKGTNWGNQMVEIVHKAPHLTLNNTLSGNGACVKVKADEFKISLVVKDASGVQLWQTPEELGVNNYDLNYDSTKSGNEAYSVVAGVKNSAANCYDITQDPPQTQQQQGTGLPTPQVAGGSTATTQQPTGTTPSPAGAAGTTPPATGAGTPPPATGAGTPPPAAGQ